MKQIDNIRLQDDPIEIEANVFSCLLLMPKDMLLEEMEKYNIKPHMTSVIGRLYGVTSQAVEYRMDLLKKHNI